MKSGDILRDLNIHRLKEVWEKGDLIQIFKFIKLADAEISEFNTGDKTIGHEWKCTNRILIVKGVNSNFIIILLANRIAC